jgi:hypothetical protein
MATTEPNSGLRPDTYRGEGDRRNEGERRYEGERRSEGEGRYGMSSRGRSPAPAGRRGIFIDTESRRGFTTTEFWLTIIGVVGLVIMAYNSDLLGVRWGMGMATAVLLGYILSRGIAKAGSDEVVRRDPDDY